MTDSYDPETGNLSEVIVFASGVAGTSGDRWWLKKIAQAYRYLCEREGWPIGPNCPECEEILTSHAGRDHKYFHEWAWGPYDGSTSGKCILDGKAFEMDSSIVKGSDVARADLTRELHGHKPGWVEPNLAGGVSDAS